VVLDKEHSVKMQQIPSRETLATFEKSKWAALARQDVTWATYYNVRQLLDQDIEGDLVECGVYAGVQVAMMYRAMVDSGVADHRKIHLFDTFSGVPPGGPEDGNVGVIGQAVCSLELVKRYLASWGVDFNQLVFHPGLLEDTLPSLQKFPIAFLRIDCDLYSGVHAVLQYLYPSLVPQGICVLDDYSFKGARQAFLDYFGPDAIDPGPGTISPLSWQRR